MEMLILLLCRSVFNNFAMLLKRVSDGYNERERGVCVLFLSIYLGTVGELLCW